MNTRYTITLALTNMQLGAGVVGLLVPIANATEYQSCHEVRFAAKAGAQQVKDVTHGQTAWFIPSRLLTSEMLIEYDFTLMSEPNMATEQSGFSKGIRREWARALGYDLSQLALSESQLQCQTTILKAIVAHIAHKFEYVNHPSSGELSNLSCDLLTGNCIDINNAFIALLAEAGIEHIYFSGVYAPKAQGAANHGWHCWVATRDGQTISYWDIAQHLKAGISEIQPLLNPCGGVRFALSQGTDLLFEVANSQFPLKKFPLPTLLYCDGRSELLLPTINLTHWNQ